MVTQGQDIQTVEAEHLLQVYRRVPIVLTHGKGSYVYDIEGHAYLDFLSGIGVASLGHAHPGLATALGEQARTLLHTSNLYFHPLQGQVGRRLTALSGLPRAFFCNSGTEAVEGCLKFARRYWHTRGETARTRINTSDEPGFGSGRSVNVRLSIPVPSRISKTLISTNRRETP